ncbi:MAG: hypothetical protein AAGF23_19585 [Acidobacteriota bacterium]
MPKQQLDDLRKTFPDGELESRPAALIFCVDRGSLVEQRPNLGKLTGFGGCKEPRF